MVDNDCTKEPVDEIHHMKGREGNLLLDTRFFKAACRHCHDIINVHSKAAIENGQSLSRHKINK